MIRKKIDAHIHFDLYQEEERDLILKSLQQDEITALITVSNHLASAEKNSLLAKKSERIFTAFGFHPEQALPTEEEIEALIAFCIEQEAEMIAVGEVGLPYYLRKENPTIPLEPYIEVLERFIVLAKKLDKPILLHAIYEDAPLVCSLLEKYSVKKAHFHWFKGDAKTIERIGSNGYMFSVTPDIVYKEATKQLVQQLRLKQLMVETDGPWPFEGPFEKQVTHPRMMHASLQEIARIKQLDLSTVYDVIYDNTVRFFDLPI